MPKNPFPDSLEKQALRLRDALFLEEFKSRGGLSGLRYCGLTSAEFRDIQVWRPHLASVLALENKTTVRNDMAINWRLLKFGIPLRIVAGDILDYLRVPDAPCSDVYNLDFYGGFTNPTRDGSSRCREAIRTLASRHREHQTSFALIATFNVRDRGVEQYDAFIAEVQSVLQGLKNVASNLAAHGKTHATKIKLCYTFTCWEAGTANDFEVEFETPFVYTSGTSTLVHFYSEFSYRPKPLGTPQANQDALTTICNLPLKRMDGRIPRTELKPDAVSRL